ncbi:MAG: intein-containing replicative DNA helicase, partial [Acidobacteria bacterium]|nr:intein-containing replicative DNA helicase [Acidobacteriota bacterium]
RVPIRELVGTSGFRVWAMNEQTLKLESALVSHAFATGVKPVFELRTRLGRRIRATANHRFRTFSAWKRLDQLVCGEYLALPRVVPGGSTQTLKDCELALLGHLIGRARTLAPGVVQYRTRDADLAQTVAALASEVFGDDICPRISCERGWFQVCLSSRARHTDQAQSAFADWLCELGIGELRPRESCIPECVFAQPAEAISTFVHHLWASGGGLKLRRTKARPTPLLCYRSSSEVVARDVQSLLLRLEVNARLAQISQGRGRREFHVLITGAEDVNHAIQRVGIMGERQTRMLELVGERLSENSAVTGHEVIPHSIWQELALPALARGGVSTRQMCAKIEAAYRGGSLFRTNISRQRAARLGAVLASKEISALSESDLYWDSIRSIEPVGTEQVFDLTVPGPHNFVANDFLVHNSIEQDADVVAFIFREEVYKPDDPELDGVAEIIVRKQRNGPTGTVKMAFLKSSTRFESLASDALGEL